MEYKLDKYQHELVNCIVKRYPFILDYNFKIQWCSSLNDRKPKLAGAFIVYEDDSVEIKINPFAQYMRILVDVIPHEFAHFIFHHQDKTRRHTKEFYKLRDELTNLWLDKSIKEEI